MVEALKPHVLCHRRKRRSPRIFLPNRANTNCVGNTRARHPVRSTRNNRRVLGIVSGQRIPCVIARQSTSGKPHEPYLRLHKPCSEGPEERRARDRQRISNATPQQGTHAGIPSLAIAPV